MSDRDVGRALPARPANRLPNLAEFLRRISEMQDEEWRKQAQCRRERVATDTFFPYRGTSQKPAKSVCSRCPVASECYEAGEGEDGIWGGELAP